MLTTIPDIREDISLLTFAVKIRERGFLFPNEESREVYMEGSLGGQVDVEQRRQGTHAKIVKSLQAQLGEIRNLGAEHRDSIITQGVPQTEYYFFTLEVEHIENTCDCI